MAPRSLLRAVIGTREGLIGVALLVFMLAVIFIGPLVAPYDPNELGVGPSSSGPSAAHLLGTDSLGRDVFSRVLCGGRSVALIPFLAVILAQIVGGGMGLIGGYFGGSTDTIVSRGFDVFLTMPPLLLVLVLISGLGTSAAVLTVVVALVFLPRAGRIVRAATRDVTRKQYVLAAEARGERSATILLREITPNIVGPTIADFALRLTYAIIFVATLNFLGLGVQPPNPDWGVMISEGRATLAVAPLEVLVPALAIALLSISVNLVADALTLHWSPDVARSELDL